MASSLYCLPSTLNCAPEILRTGGPATCTDMPKMPVKLPTCTYNRGKQHAHMVQPPVQFPTWAWNRGASTKHLYPTPVKLREHATYAPNTWQLQAVQSFFCSPLAQLPPSYNIPRLPFHRHLLPLFNPAQHLLDAASMLHHVTQMYIQGLNEETRSTPAGHAPNSCTITGVGVGQEPGWVIIPAILCSRFAGDISLKCARVCQQLEGAGTCVCTCRISVPACTCWCVYAGCMREEHRQ